MLLVAMSLIAKRRNIDPPPNPPPAVDTGRIGETAIDIKLYFSSSLFYTICLGIMLSPAGGGRGWIKDFVMGRQLTELFFQTDFF